MQLKKIDSGNSFDFGRVSDHYARYRDIYPQSMYDKLISFGIGKQGQKLLDLGSGTAILPLRLYHTGAHITAADISPEQIAVGKERAKATKAENISFKVCTAEDTGFPDDTFDAVTAVQCFHYFDADKAAAEIHRILKPDGLFCKIFMDWLPYQDSIIKEMEELVLRYNPSWNGSGFERFRYRYPEWAENRFDIHTIHSYDVTLPFTKEEWLGRVMTCRGVGASLSKADSERFCEEYKSVLEKYDEPLMLKHRIHMEVYKSVK